MNLPDELINELMPFIVNDAIFTMPYHQKMNFGMQNQGVIMQLIKDSGIDWNALLIKNNATLGNAEYVEMCDFAADFIIGKIEVVE